MLMAGRKFIAGAAGYRYGFNGKENDNEVKGGGNQIAYENRIYDSRLGRWNSIDPLQQKYPNESHYGFVSSNPILYADKAGLDKIITITTIGKDGSRTVVQRIDKNFVKYSADYRTHELPDMPGKEFIRGIKQDVYESYVIDLSNPKNSTYDVQFKTIESFNYQFTYWADKLLSGGDESTKDAFGYLIFGQGNDMGAMKKAPRAAVGSEILDIDKLISTAEAWREFGPRTIEGDEFKHEVFQLLKDEKWKGMAEAVDNLLDAIGAVNSACNDCATNKMTELMNNAISSSQPTTNTQQRQKSIIKILPTKKGSQNDTSMWIRDPADNSEPDTIFFQPYKKEK